MRRNRPRLVLAALTAAALASMALADQVGRVGVAPERSTPTLRQAAQDGGRVPGGLPGGLQVGGRLDPARLHPVRRPGLYGMSEPPPGSRYGIAEGRLIRYDPRSAQVLSIIREVDRILD